VYRVFEYLWIWQLEEAQEKSKPNIDLTVCNNVKESKQQMEEVGK